MEETKRRKLKRFLIGTGLFLFGTGAGGLTASIIADNSDKTVVAEQPQDDKSDLEKQIEDLQKEKERLEKEIKTRDEETAKEEKEVEIKNEEPEEEQKEVELFNISDLVVITRMDNEGNEVPYILKKTENTGIYTEIHNLFNVATTDAEPAKVADLNCISVQSVKPFINYLDNETLLELAKLDGKVTLEILEGVFKNATPNIEEKNNEFDISSLIVINITDMNGENVPWILKTTEEDGIYEEVHGLFKGTTNGKEGNYIQIEEYKPVIEYIDKESAEDVERIKGKVSLSDIDGFLQRLRQNLDISSKTKKTP